MPIYKAKIKCFVGNSLRNPDEEFEYNGEPCSHIKLISGTESPSTPASAEVIEEVINGYCIFPVLFKLLPVNNLVIVPIIAEILKPSPFSVADNPISLKISDVK